MADMEPIFEYRDESQAERLTRKSKESPFMIIGLVGLVTACAIGAHKFKNRGDMKTSVFLMHLRVAAQGTVVGALTLGMAYSLAKKHLFPEKKNE